MIVAPGETYPWAPGAVLRSRAQLLGDLFLYWRKVACGAFREHIQDDLGTPVKSVVFTGEKRACSGLGAYGPGLTVQRDLTRLTSMGRMPKWRRNAVVNDVECE